MYKNNLRYNPLKYLFSVLNNDLNHMFKLSVRRTYITTGSGWYRVGPRLQNCSETLSFGLLVSVESGFLNSLRQVYMLVSKLNTESNAKVISKKRKWNFYFWKSMVF